MKKAACTFLWLFCSLFYFNAIAQTACSGHCINLTNGGYVDGGLNNVYPNCSALTVEAWIYPTAYPAAGSTATIVGKVANTAAIVPSAVTFWVYMTNNSLVATFSNGTTLSTVTTAAPNTSGWTHIAARWTSGQQPQIIINGSGTTTGTGSIATGMLNATAPNVRMGGSSYTSETGFRGYIDEVRIFGMAIPTPTLSSFYNQTAYNHPNLNFLVDYFRFQDGTGITTYNEKPATSTVVVLNGNASWTPSMRPCNVPDVGPVTGFSQMGSSLNKVALTWSYPYTYPLNSVLENMGGMRFDVRRDGIPIASIGYVEAVNGANARQFSFIDSNLTKCNHVYDIRPYWMYLNSQTIQGTFPPPVAGYTTDIHFNATNGDHPTKTTLSWDNVANQGVTGFEIKRNGQQIAVLSSGSSTSYNDFDGTPGVRYEYELVPLGLSKPARICADTGWIKENGRLSGYVKSPLQAAVPGVVVTATANIGGNNYIYSDTTDNTGFYEIREVFYNTQATYTLTPSKGTHQFNPATAQRTLDVLAYNAPQANFTDTSVFTVSGQVTFPNQLGQPGCATEGVKILVNGIDRGVLTDASGNWSFVITDEATYSFTPVFKHHTFNPPGRTQLITDNTGSLNFSNTTTDTLRLSLMGYCGTQVCDNSTIQITGTGTGGCYSKPFTVPGNGEFIAVVPAQEYLVTIQSVADANSAQNEFNVKNYSLPSSFTVNLSQRDTVVEDIVNETMVVTVGDTIFLPGGPVIPLDTAYTYDTVTVTNTPASEARFVYGGRFTLTVQGLDTLQPCNKVLLQQGNEYQTRIDIFREYTYNNFTSYCRLDSGLLTIYDDVSDSNFVYYPIDSGIVFYNINPGKPNITSGGQHPYEKFVTLGVSGPGATGISQTMWMTVLGNRQLTPTFVTKTPELPFFVLHDPPGNGSSAELSDGTTLSYNYETGVETSWGMKEFVNVEIGAEIPVPFTGIVFNNGGRFESSIQSNNKKTSNKSVNTSFTMGNSYATSGDPEFIGEDADVVVGAALNLIYGASYILNYDSANCGADVDTALTWGANDFATTYVYTIGHIKYTLIPQFEYLRDYYANLGSDSALSYQNQINVWNQVVDQNHQNIVDATFIENRSFSGGVSYTNTTSSENSKGFTIAYEQSLEGSLMQQLNLGTEHNVIEAGLEVNLSWTTSKTKDTQTSNTKEVSYTLSDSDPGDFFSVDIKTDEVYGTPAFKMVAGTSSCPHEEGTQQRDLPEITVISPLQNNVPVTQQAVFTVQMNNHSESGETRTYEVIVDPNSNLDGAIIRLGGQLISQFPASFTIPVGPGISAVLTVEKGPVAVNYNDLKLIIYSPCDPDVYDEATFTVGYQSNCPPVTLYTPSNNWLVNAQDSVMKVTYGGFNANDSSLAEIGLEIRIGNSWNIIPASRVTLQQLQQNANPYYAVNLDMDGFADGNYDVRAYSICNTQPPAKAYSPTLNGVIDYSSLTLFGTPSPSDGVLNYGEDISVAFSEVLDCGGVFNLQNSMSDSVTLRRVDNGQLIPSQYSCNGSSIIITTNPPALIDSLQNVAIKARVKNIYDVTGNILNSPIEWSFVVNRSKQYWTPSSLSVSLEQNGTQNVTADLKNDGIASATYTLTKVPVWMNTAASTGNIAAGTFTAINFTVSASLNPGVYNDTVVADFGGGNQQYLLVRLEVRYAAPYWTVNANQFQYTMSIIANFSTTSLNAPLSSNANDKIAVFAGNQCRGVANVQYAQIGNVWRAFITVHSNNISSEQLRFRMWSSTTGTEYEAVETATFVNNTTLGQYLAPMILHPAGVVQRIPVAQGWNWFSLNVTNADMSVNNMLRYLVADSAMIVKTDNKYAQFSPALNAWAGSLPSFSYDKSYMIFMSHADTLQFVGNYLEDTVTVSFATGWNWAPYPQWTIKDVNTYMSSFVAANNDVLKSQTQFATHNGTNWSGSLTQLQPGRGYKLQTANGGTVLVAPDRAVPAWNVSEFDYEYNMNITAVLKVNGVESNGNYLIGAFINGICVGVSDIQSAGSYARIFMTLHGNTTSNNQPIEFRVYGYSADSVYAPVYVPVNYLADAQNGSVESPFVLNITTATGTSVAHFDGNGYALYQNMPNPFSNQTAIRFVVPVTELVTIEVFDYTGKQIRVLANQQFASGEHVVEFNQNELSSGIYFYRMKAGSFVQTKRMIIQ